MSGPPRADAARISPSYPTSLVPITAIAVHSSCRGDMRPKCAACGTCSVTLSSPDVTMLACPSGDDGNPRLDGMASWRTRPVVFQSVRLPLVDLAGNHDDRTYESRVGLCHISHRGCRHTCDC